MTWWWLVPLAPVALMLRVHLFGRRTFDASPRDALIVLGARVLPDGTPSEALVARVERGVQLFQQGLAPRLVISGGGAGETSEAAIGRELALRAGVPESACLIETKSGSTFANAVHSVELLRPLGVTRVFVVTDDFHAFRAAAHFQRAGFDVEVVSVRRALAFDSRLWWTLREVVAVLRRPWLLH